MKKLLILGAGESGIGAALLGQHHGWDVFVSDNANVTTSSELVLKSSGISFESEKHSMDRILSADLIVKSPGIPNTVPPILEARASGIQVVSEIEFASRYTDAILIGVTGSNGKTTTASWIFDILKTANMNVAFAGNVGYSFARLLSESQPEVVVLELSSFQLEDIQDFHPHIAVITNITPDHLDRYNYNFSDYIAAKMQIIKNQSENDFFIFDADDNVTVEALKTSNTAVHQFPFSTSQVLDRGIYTKDNQIIFQSKKKTTYANIRT